MLCINNHKNLPMKSPNNNIMPKLRKRPSRRRRSHGYCTAAAAAASTMFLSLSTTTSSSALLHYSPPACFVSPKLSRHRNNNNNHGRLATFISPPGGSSLSTKPRNLSPSLLHWHSPAAAAVLRQSRLAMNQNNDDNEEEDLDEDEDEFNGDVKSNLDKIAWLPSVKLGKQPYKPTKATSRKESTDGAGYISSSINNASPPAGFQNIEILPVLPMTMVHGLEGINLTPGEDQESSMLSSKISDLDREEGSGYGMGVWEEEQDPYSALVGSSNALGPLFSGTSSYLPHTKGHVFTVAEPRYKKLYDDLLRMGNYYGMKKDSAMRRMKENKTAATEDAGSSYAPQDASSLPDPDEKRRFIVTASNPAEDGVFAEYGLLFQLKDLDEIAAVASYEMGGEGMTVDELQDLVESHGADQGQQDYDDADESGNNGNGVEDFMDILLRTHYEATHDVVGRVKIHRFTNPEVYSEGPEGEEYLMAEATVLDVVDNDRVKMLKERKKRAVQELGEEQPTSSTSLTATRTFEDQVKEQAMVGDVAKAVARIKEELRSSVSEAFNNQQQLPSPPQLDSESIEDKLRAALDSAPILSPNNSINDATTNTNNNTSNKLKAPIPLGPKGMYVERRSNDSLSKEEKALRESFAKLVALQHELKEECRFTKISVQTFGIGPVGVWLSAAAWSQFVEKRLEATHGDMQSDLQAKLVEYLAERGPSQGSNDGIAGGSFSKYGEDGIEGEGMEGETIDFEELSLELQQEFQLVQARATEELGPLALERAIQMQRIVQAESYPERLDLLRECVDNERKRLEAKKMLKSLGFHGGGNNDRGGGQVFDSGRSISREEARSLFERLISTDVPDIDQESKDEDEESFQ
mmetsp:Transcript_22620/g.48982  ORF Transcript_22620/g.48982 Transcript_22620/m.48982 type:complete len:864 (-) Transcript_22620:68-2659(-)